MQKLGHQYGGWMAVQNEITGFVIRGKQMLEMKELR